MAQTIPNFWCVILKGKRFPQIKLLLLDLSKALKLTSPHCQDSTRLMLRLIDHKTFSRSKSKTLGQLPISRGNKRLWTYSLGRKDGLRYQGNSNIHSCLRLLHIHTIGQEWALCKPLLWCIMECNMLPNNNGLVVIKDSEHSLKGFSRKSLKRRALNMH